MKKSILWIGYNFYPEPTGIGKYSGDQVTWLAKKGYDCTVITSYPYYPFWKVQEPFVKHRHWYKTEVQHFISGGKLTIHRCPIYIPAMPSGMKRVLLDFSFFISAFFKLIQLLPQKKQDFIITILPSVTLGLLGILYKKIRGGKLICHVHDLQIEVARDFNLIKSPKVIKALFKFEKYVFDECDAITCVGEGMARIVKEKARKEVTLFFNTTDLEVFKPIKDRESLKQKFGFKPTDKIVLYSGAIGEKQGIDTILYAAEKFANVKNLRFVICGSGPYKNKLEFLAASLQLQNLTFMPLQPIQKFNDFLNMADVHLVVQKANAGDLVMPSKLNTVLAIGGLALVTANPGSGIYSLIKKYNMGILVDAENQHALNEGLQKAIIEDTSVLTDNARRYAESYLSTGRIMKSFEETCLKNDFRKFQSVQKSKIFVTK